jgi:hypothetical protein
LHQWQSGVGVVTDFGLETHGGTVRASVEGVQGVKEENA